LETNRDTLTEGSSLILTLTKTTLGDESKTKRINVRKIASLKDLFNSSIKEITFDIKSKEELSEIKNYLDEKGNTIVNINISNEFENLKFKLKNSRNIDRKSINILRNKQFNLYIHQ
jgi:DNA polymerase III subunit alpha